MDLKALYLASDRPTARLVLLHGYGSDERDMAGLGESLPDEIDVVCLQAPHFMEHGGFAWFDIAVGGEEFAYDLEGFQHSTAMVLRAIAELRLEDVPLVVGGFSQGAMIAAAATLVDPAIDAAWLMSGAFPPGVDMPDAPPRPILVQHGTDDDVLPLPLGEDLVKRLREVGMAVDFREYGMGHSVSAKSLADGVAWLSALSG